MRETIKITHLIFGYSCPNPSILLTCPTNQNGGILILNYSPDKVTACICMCYLLFLAVFLVCLYDLVFAVNSKITTKVYIHLLASDASDFRQLLCGCTADRISNGYLRHT